MSFKSFLFLCWACFLVSFTGTWLSQWKYIPEKAQVKFYVVDNNSEAGVFTGISGNVDFDPATPEKGSITAEIDVATINTGSEARDGHLRDKDFFETAKYPKLRFISESISKTDSGFVANGKLTIKKTTKAVSIPFQFINGTEEATFKGWFTINRYDYGVGDKSDGIGNAMHIDLEIPVKKQ